MNFKNQNIISIYPSHIEIDNYEDNKKIEGSLSVWDKVRFTYSFKAYIKKTNIDESKTLILPLGYDINYIKYNFPNHIIKDYRKEYNKIVYPNKDIKILYEPRDKIQEEAIKFLTGNKFTKDVTQKLLGLNTGSGKTFITLNYIANTKRRPILFVDQLHLKEQWIESILKFTDIKEDEIYVISGRSSIEALENMNEEERDKIKFYICIYRTIQTYIDGLPNPETIDIFMREVLKISTKIFDEAHIEYMNIFYLDSFINTESVYITATPRRSDPIENKVFQNMFKNVRRILSPENNTKYHNIIMIKVNSKPTMEEQLNCKNKYGFSANEYSNYILKHYDFFMERLEKILFESVLKNGKNHKKIAILVSLNKLVDKLHDDLYNIIKDNKWEYTVSKFNGNTKNKEEALQADIIVTTDKSFGKAIDVQNLTVLINLVPFGSPVINEQIIGRLRYIEGKEVYYFDIIDTGFESIKNQLYYKTKVFNKKGKKIIEVNM